MPEKKIIHYRNNCIGCGNCVEYAADYWQLDESDGKANLLESQLKKGIYSRKILLGDEDKNNRAADSCPVSIIQVI